MLLDYFFGTPCMTPRDLGVDQRGHNTSLTIYCDFNDASVFNFLNLLLLDLRLRVKVSNHPVHIIDEEERLYPTALIPFCAISNNMSAMGVKIEQMDVPVCNSFRPKLLRDQLCYEVDTNKYKDSIDEGELSITLGMPEI